MKVQVQIHRQRPDEANPGSIQAWITERRESPTGFFTVNGSPLLRRGSFKDIDAAISHIDMQIVPKLFRIGEMPEIEYLVEDDAKTEA